MKKVILILSEIIILIIYVYLLSIDNIPSNIILFEGENLNIKTLFGVTCETVNTELINTEQEDTAVQVSSNLNKTTVGQKSTLLFKLFDKITLKRSRCRRNKKCKKVVPVGNAIGLKLYTKGVLVVGMNEVENEENQAIKPYENTGIVEGDMIISVNNNAIASTSDLLAEVSKSNGKELQVEYVRDGNIYETDIKPEK